jgi:transposase
MRSPPHRLWPGSDVRSPLPVPEPTPRPRAGPSQFLANYTGYLQAGAYSGYDAIYLGSALQIIDLACWAHALRKFLEARSSSPAEASLVLQMIQRLYYVEDRARPLDDAARCAMRQEEATPICPGLGNPPASAAG